MDVAGIERRRHKNGQKCEIQGEEAKTDHIDVGRKIIQQD